ncbi:N-ethylmaleimide reductase [Pseudobythopirellula maris]|uniref:N-ethylmaleimide reductase n=1 Tax=Pseudobythopirellula maris TaxID=2527991 RepID=A0A5C5ZL83_9BACT|nr:alkene reductase [Pseudobythopirellula maris]TWT87193.1 N-ethylmaleimide reductase [Pseudobythopirellula maris]
MPANDPLFEPLRLGAIEIPNRVVMAPLTRARATDRTPNALMAEYYQQRASAGLIVSEATAFSEQGYGWPGAPALYNDQQVDGWRRITDAVHQAGGRIFLQLWHMGRVSHPDFQAGRLPVAPSAVAAAGDAHTPTGKKPFVTPHALSVDEIARVVDDYAAATARARRAGFDGVEVHGANGYLIDQFLRDASNRRDDQYGGSIENRLRFLGEVLAAVTAEWAPERTGLRLSPTMNGMGMSDSDPVALYTAAAEMLNGVSLAYVHTAEAIAPGRLYNPDAPRVTPHIRRAYEGVLMTNGGYDHQTAAEAIRSGAADAIAFGQSYIANPDLVERFRAGAALNEPDHSTYYTHGAEGYTDYPAMAETARTATA